SFAAYSSAAFWKSSSVCPSALTGACRKHGSHETNSSKGLDSDGGRSSIRRALSSDPAFSRGSVRCHRTCASTECKRATVDSGDRTSCETCKGRGQSWSQVE